MLARVCLNKTPRFLCQLGMSCSLRTQGMRSPSVFAVPTRPLMVFLSGLDRDDAEDREDGEQFEEDIDGMGGDDYVFEKKEHLKGKVARVLKANKKVSMIANGKVAALSDLTYLKLRNGWK